MFGKEIVALQVEVEMNEEVKEVVSYFKNLGSCFSKDEGPEEDTKMK